eukprot:NODE_26_length_35450_cov_0.398320.p5 type:complete len:495 gc:universal NODE_26_length_35450_cov_0.398320:32405-33889(+)
MYIWAVATTNKLYLRIEKHASLSINSLEAVIEKSILYRNGDFELHNVTFTNLSPNTQYKLMVDNKEYIYSTLGTGKNDFTIMAGACSKYKSNSFAERPSNIAFMVHIGDLYYADITDNSIDSYADQFRLKFQIENQNGRNSKSIFEDSLFYYIYDDHDFSDNNSNSASSSHTAGTVSHKIFAPQLPNDAPYLNATFNEPKVANKILDARSLFTPAYKSFTNNNIRFVIMDLRADQDPSRMMDQWQKSQIEAELANSAKYDAIIVFSSLPFNGIESATSEPDKWMHHVADRAWFSNLVSEHSVSNLVMVAGDAHMLAYDDGTNNDFGSDGPAGFPIFQCAPLSNYGSCKGGPYTTPPFTHKYYVNHYYCLFDFKFENNKLCIIGKGMQSGSSTPVFEQQLCRGATDSWIKMGNKGSTTYPCVIPLFPVWLVILIILVAFILTSCGLFLCYRCYKRRKRNMLVQMPENTNIEMSNSISASNNSENLVQRKIITQES